MPINYQKIVLYFYKTYHYKKDFSHYSLAIKSCSGNEFGDNRITINFVSHFLNYILELWYPKIQL